jgi:tetratricopeptide (TPR) repeat protein
MSTQLRDLPERQRSMHAVFAHSMRLLLADEHQALCALSLFRGGFTAEAAEAVAHASPQALAALVDKSLLRMSQLGRYDMHELLRQFVERELHASGAFAAVWQRYRTYFMSLSNAAKDGLVGEESGTWIARLELEIDNVRTVLRLLQVDAPEEALRMALDLFWLWQSRGYLQEGLDWLSELSNPELPITPLLRANSYRGASFLAICLNKVEHSFQLISKCLTIIQSLDLTDPLVAEAFVHARATLNYVYLFQGDYEQVVAIGQEVIALAEKWDFKAHVVGGWYNLGEAYMMQERFDAAKSAYEKSLAVCRQIGDLRRSGRRVARLAKIAVSQGDFVQTRALFEQMVRIYEGSQDQVGLSMALLVMVWLATREGLFERAALLLGATETILDSNPVIRTWPQDRNSYDAAIDRLRAHLSANEFEELSAKGRALSLAQTIALALADSEQTEQKLSRDAPTKSS